MNNPHQDNGILGRVDGQYVAGAISLLPPADTAEDRVHTIEIDAGHAGRVRLYARRRRVRHNKHSHWFWSVFRAEGA